MDYEVLRIIWWGLLLLLMAGFAVMDGFDLGVSALLPFLGRTDIERRIMINSIGPVWEGNQVWFVLGGGAIFAAWPIVYAVAFSGFYFAMLVVLLTLIVRPVGFKYRSKLANPRWRSTWDFVLAIAAIVTSLVLGVAIGNVMQGVPFHFDHSLRMFYTGTFWQLFNPFALYCGLVSLSMFVMQGAVYLVNKTENALKEKARFTATISAVVTAALFLLGAFWVRDLAAYHISSPILTSGPSNPLNKTVVMQVGGWLMNDVRHPWMMAAPIIGVLAAAITAVLVRRYQRLAMVVSSLSVIGIIATFGLSMFPFILPSSSHPSMSLTVWDSSSSQKTLFIMMVCAIIFVPIILAYTAWVYRVMRGPVTEKTIADNHQSY